MFFIMGISPRSKQLDFSQQGVCPACGRLTRFEVWVTMTCLTLFFIPTLRWGKRYYLKSTCCGAVCELPRSLGDAIARGEVTSIDPSSLHFSGGAPCVKRCPACGFTTDEDYQFCPKCGSRL